MDETERELREAVEAALDEGDEMRAWELALMLSAYRRSFCR